MMSWVKRDKQTTVHIAAAADRTSVVANENIQLHTHYLKFADTLELYTNSDTNSTPPRAYLQIP
jgi:hypothetical protein